MKRPLCSVVMATYNRAHLLWRSVYCYNGSRFPLDRLEVVVVDDGSADETRTICERFHPYIDVKYVLLRKPAGLWRDCAAVINHGLRIATGDYILLTHPEVMPGRDSIAHCVEAGMRPQTYSCCKPYYLRPRDQERLDDVDWLGVGPLAVRQINGFYDDHDENQPPGFTPRKVEASPDWRSWVFGGCGRSTWKWLGGMIESQKWGSVDLIWDERRRRLGIEDACGLAETTYCVHQNHDRPGDTPTPRDLKAAHEEAAAAMSSEEKGRLQYPVINALW